MLSASISRAVARCEVRAALARRAHAGRRNAGFLQLADNSPDIKAQWKEFPGVYRCYPTAGAKKAATVYAKFGDPRVQNEHGQPILFAAQFYGSGRILYIGSPEMWRLRAVDEAYFERFWTKTIREVGPGAAAARHGPRLIALGAQPVRLGADGPHSGQSCWIRS